MGSMIVEALIVALLHALLIALLAFAQKKGSAVIVGTEFIVRLPKLLLFIGLGFGGFMSFTFISFLLNVTSFEYWVFIPFSICISAGFLLAYTQLRWRVVVVDQWINYTPVFGMTREYQFSDITKVKDQEKLELMTLYSGNKRMFSVDYRAPGIEKLVVRLKGVPFI